MAEVKIKGGPPPPRTFSKEELKLVFPSIGMKPKGRDVFGESRELLHLLAKDPALAGESVTIVQTVEKLAGADLKCLIGGRWGPPHWLKE